MAPATGGAPAYDSSVTLEDHGSRRQAAAGEPGLVLLFAAGRAQLQLLPLQAGTLLLGRGQGSTLVDDPLASRHHAAVQLDAHGWQVRDLGSRNGTFVDGARLEGAPVCRPP